VYPQDFPSPATPPTRPACRILPAWHFPRICAPPSTCGRATCHGRGAAGIRRVQGQLQPPHVSLAPPPFRLLPGRLCTCTQVRPLQAGDSASAP